MFQFAPIEWSIRQSRLMYYILHHIHIRGRNRCRALCPLQYKLVEIVQEWRGNDLFKIYLGLNIETTTNPSFVYSQPLSIMLLLYSTNKY